MNAEKEAKELISKIKKELEWIEKTIHLVLPRYKNTCSTCLLMKKLNITNHS
jgi:predicted transcriptional regulator